MSVKVITPPAVEPVSLSEMRLHLKVDAEGSPPEHPDDDLITAQIQAAREWCEAYLGYGVVEQTVRHVRDNFPAGRVFMLPFSKLISVTSIEYKDGGAWVEFDSSNYAVDTDSEIGAVILNENTAWPSLDDPLRAVRATYVVGFQGEGSPPDYQAGVPEAIKAAMKLLVGDMYENRTDTVVGTIISKTQAAANLLHPYRRILL